MRNPFRRQTETAAPTLRERAAALRENLSRQDAAPGERADLYDRLLTLYAEDREARPVQGREDGTVASRAAILVSNRLWALARETIAMPLPKTLDGLRATALASAILCEAEHSEDDPTTLAAIGLTRAALSVTGTSLPPGFIGFGDEADHEECDAALFAKPGSVPAWAIAEIQGKDAARTSSQTRPPEPVAPAAAAEDTFAPAPTDLADACLWAIRHRAWADRASSVQDWSDERGDAELDRTNAVFTRAIDEPSTNLREITAKAAFALEDFERFTLRPGHKADDGTRIVHTVLREVVGVGREAGTPSPLASYSGLTAAILDGWAAWGATTGAANATAEDLAAWEQASAKRDHLLYAAMALPATPESIEAKALACAWMEWVNAERPGQPRDTYGQADQLVYDIHATIMQRGQRDYNAVSPVPFTLSETALVPTVDFAGASMVELWDIFKAAELVCEIASTAAGNRHGRAGSLTRWVSNALCAVLTEAVDEARRRAPDNSDDRVARLSMICAATLDNEDPAEIQAFARELLAMVER
ncbi:hypothetical protein [Methylobacterium sp. J-067]|uniref:hypothetical protein n=1 Tax=Methylobacterium sp. J-067 TaxID=2836648 RepID=UPI001FB8F2D3|nr:hypothetical protein [Methylobacterium sp. J-067]MCJ2023970.1 hypothetical protein [Methylobacterium sp. J-067]